MIKDTASLAYHKTALIYGYEKLPSSANVSPRDLLAALTRQEAMWREGSFQNIVSMNLPEFIDHLSVVVSGDFAVGRFDKELVRNAKEPEADIFRFDLRTRKVMAVSICDDDETKLGERMLAVDGDLLVYISTPLHWDPESHGVKLYFRSLATLLPPSQCHRAEMTITTLEELASIAFIKVAVHDDHVALVNSQDSENGDLFIYNWTCGTSYRAHFGGNVRITAAAFVDDNLLALTDTTNGMMRLCIIDSGRCKIQIVADLCMPFIGMCSEMIREGHYLHKFSENDEGLFIIAFMRRHYISAEPGLRSVFFANTTLVVLRRTALRAFVQHILKLNPPSSQISPLTISWEVWGPKLACVVPIGGMQPGGFVVHGARVVALQSVEKAQLRRRDGSSDARRDLIFDFGLGRGKYSEYDPAAETSRSPFFCPLRRKDTPHTEDVCIVRTPDALERREVPVSVLRSEAISDNAQLSLVFKANRHMYRVAYTSMDKTVYSSVFPLSIFTYGSILGAASDSGRLIQYLVPEEGQDDQNDMYIIHPN